MLHLPESRINFFEQAVKTMYRINIRSRESANTAKLVVSLEIAHQGLGHVDRQQIQKMFNLTLVDGLNVKATKDGPYLRRLCRWQNSSDFPPHSYQSESK